MDFEVYHKYPPGDPTLVEKIVCHLKAQGIFDNFRKECLSDVDTKPAYQNLRQRVDGSVAGYLAGHKWKPDLNKNQLRESLRKYIQNGGFLEVGVERIVDQVVNPKIGQVFLPRVRDVVFEGLGLKEESDNNETTSDRPASSSCMPSSSSAAATSSTHTSASICNQTEGSKEKANLEKEVVPSTASETKKEDSESAQVGHSEEFVDSDMELDPESQSEETVIKLETQNETRSNDSSDTRISGISDLTSVKSNASNGDDNFDKSDSDEEKEDTDNINKSMTSINEDDESSQDKSEVFSNVIHENTFSNSSFPPEFNTQVENVEIENDQIGTSVVECVTTENNEGDTDGRDTPNPIPQSNFDSDSNGMYEHEHESTALENDHNNSDKEFDEDVDENVCEEISRGLNSDHKEECHHDESQSETDLERFDSTSNEMRFSENTIYFDSGNLEQSSEDENHEIHSLKKQEETEKERKHRKDQERKHHSRHKHSKDHHSNSSSGGSRDDRNHSRSKDKHRHNRDDDSHSTDADGKSRKTDDHSDSKHRRSKDHRGEEKARTSKEETSRSDNGKKNKYVEKVTSSHKDRSSSRHYENVDEENAFNEDEESKSECDEKNIHEETIKYSHEEKLSRSRDRKKAKKDKTRYYDYEDTTSDHEEATRRESDDKTKYRENPDCSKKETPTKGHKKVSKDHEQDEITSDYELATKSKTKVKNKNQEKVKYSHKDENTHSSKYAPKAETHDLEYEEATTFDHKESRKNESKGKSYKDEAELSHEEMPTRRRNRKKAFKEDYEYGEITSDYEEASRSESEEKYKYQEKLKSDEKSSTHSRDRKKASKQETHNYEETQFDTEETKKSKSGEKTIARSKDRKRSTREELNKNEESEFDLKEQSNDEFEVENEYQEVEKSKRERSSCSRRHKDKTIERENDDEYGKTTSDGEEAGKSESEEKNRNQGKVKKEKHGRSRDYETSHIDEQDKEIIDEEETNNKANSDEKKKYRDSKHDRKEKHSRSQDKKHESNVKAQDDEYENIMFGQQEANESDDVENENQEVESSQKASHSRSRDHKHVSKEKSHDGDHKRKKEEQTRSEKKHDSNSKKEHSSIKDDVKKDRSHKTGSREHRSSHRSSRDKHATKESENYDKEKENNDDKSKKDKSKKSRDSCKPVDKSREERRSTDGDNSGTGREEGTSVGGSASSRYTRSQKTKTKESRSGGKGSHSSTSDAAVPQDSQHYEECVEAETVLQYSFTPNDDGGHPAVYTVHVDNDDNSTSAGEETSAIVCEENEVNTKDDDGDKADDAATKEEENKKQGFNLHTTEVLDNIITLEFGVSQNSNNELEIPSFNSPINTRENSENKENCDENLKLNYQTFDTDVMSNNSDFQLDGETKILQVNEEIDLDKPNAEILVSSQNSETQNSRDDRVEFRKKRFAENFAELRKIMRERRRNKRIQKKCLSVGNTAANDDHSSMTDQSMNNQALVEENRLGESSTSVECVEEVVVKEPDESSFKNSTDETIPLPLPVVETNSFSYKRPKVASNIFEVRKIIKARKRLRRIEEKKRFSLPHFNSNKLSVEGVTKTQIEAFKQNNDKFRGNYSTEKSRSCKKIRDTEKPKLAKHSKRDSKGRFIRNEPKCEESNTENLITLKIKSQERVGSETKDFECKSTLSYQDINQLASKCLVVKLKKLDDINFKKDSVAVTNSVESLITDNTDDQPESKLPFQSNENGCESVAEAKTSAKGIIEEKSLNVDARQVEEVDLLICESEVVDNNCVPLEGSTGEKYQLSPHRQSESTSEAPVLDEVDERFTEENPISNSTEVENSCETGPIVLEDDEIGSHSCEIPKPVANAPEIGGTTERITALNDPTTQQSSDKLQSIEVQNSNASEISEEEIETNSGEKMQSIEVQSLNASQVLRGKMGKDSRDELRSIEVQNSNASETMEEEETETNSSEKLPSIEVKNSNALEILEEELESNSNEKLQSIEDQSSNAPETVEEEIESNSSEELQSIKGRSSNASEIVEEEKESNSNEILKSTEDQNSNAPETMEEEIESNSSEELQSIEGQSSNASEILREEMVNDSSEKFQSVELVPNAQNYNSLEPTVSDNLQPLTTFEVGVSSPMRGFDTNEITEKARMKLEKFKTVLNACEKEYNVLKDMEKTEFVTSDFELDKKFDSYLEKECGFQVLRKDCILLPSLNDENYFFDKESGWYYLKNRLINRSQICKKNMNAKGTSVKKSKVVKSFESSSEKRSVGGKLLSQESRKSPVKLRISIRNPNSSVIETEEINVPYTSDVESLTDGSTGRISIDSRRISEDVSSESELNNCGDRVRASTPLQDNSTAESERVQPLVHQVPLLETPSKSTKKKRAHSRRNKSLNYSNKKSSHQEFKIKSCPEAENNNLPSGEGRAQLSPFKITFSRSNSSLPKIIAPQSPSSQSNNFSMDAAVPSESESRLVVGKRHASKTDDGSCSPKKKFHSDTDFIRVDQAIEAVTDSLNNSFEEEVDIRHDDSIESSMIGEALKNLIAESGLATTTQTPPSYQETKKPAKITKHNRNQKLSIESESTDNPPKKLRNSERLSAGVRLPKRFEDADLCFDFGNRRKRKQDESAIDSSVDNEPPRKRRLSNVVTSTRRSSR